MLSKSFRNTNIFLFNFEFFIIVITFYKMLKFCIVVIDVENSIDVFKIIIKFLNVNNQLF